MSLPIPSQLSQLLEFLGIELRPYRAKAQRLVQRLSRDLPQFESVWLDAFVQVNMLTYYQAAEINQGRGRQLRAGKYIIDDLISDLGYAKCYKATQLNTKQVVCLTVTNKAVANDLPEQYTIWNNELSKLRQDADSFAECPILEFGQWEDRFWIASEISTGESVAAWMVRNGRLPAAAVLEIARQISRKLADTFAADENVGLLHGDLRATNLLLTRNGKVNLRAGAIRQVLRADEAFALHDMPPEAYEGLAPERVQQGQRTDVATELYAFGCLCWHLLTGRSAVPGGNSVTKLQNIAKGKIPDVNEFAYDVPRELTEVIRHCLEFDPTKRPASFSSVASQLGAPTSTGQKKVAKLVSDKTMPMLPVRKKRDSKPAKNSSPTLLWTAICLVALAAITSPFWKSSWPIPSVNLPQPLPNQFATNQNSTTSSPALAASSQQPKDLAPRREELLLTPELLVQSKLQTLFSNLKSGTLLRPANGQRINLEIPSDGLVLETDGLRFENIDFVMKVSDASSMISLAAANVEFVGCSFQCYTNDSVEKTSLPVAIRWSGKANLQESEDLLLNGNIRLQDCCFYQVASAIECRTAGAKKIELHNVLHLGPGALVDLNRIPLIDEPMNISLSHVTIRNAQSLVKFHYRMIPQAIGKISFQASGCALIPSENGALFSFEGEGNPVATLRQIQWQGQGSLLRSNTPVAHWQDTNGKNNVLDDTRMKIAGLVHSKVDFAGDDLTKPNDSKLTSWQVPLRSTDAPGIIANRLSLPKILLDKKNR